MKNIIERIKTKPGYKILAGLILVVGLIYGSKKINEIEINNIKNNPDILVECDIKGEGWMLINKSKIVDILDDGTFVFTNGYAKSCKVENIKE